MSPLDDELRSALSSRTASLTPSPDLLAGVERRAVRMRRQRVAAAVAGSALAVSALGLGGPLLASSLTSTASDPAGFATTAPQDDDRYALDPQAPWAYRGDVVVQAPVEGVARQDWAQRRGAAPADVDFTLLYGEVVEPRANSEAVSVFVAQEPAGAAFWGVVRTGESGVEFLRDEPLAPGTTALATVLPGEAVSRLLVLAAPATTVQYCPDGILVTPQDPVAEGSCDDIGDSGAGLGSVPLDGDTTNDAYRVLSSDGQVVTDSPAPSQDAIEGEPEGPGTGEQPFVDADPYRLDLDDPWAYRGPVELRQHPDLAGQDERLFVAGGRGRDDGTWSQRPLYALERPDGLSVLVVLHRSGEAAFVTTTWQQQDQEPRQAEQEVQDGQLVVQSFLPLSDTGGVLVVLAAPRTGAVEVDVPEAFQNTVSEGVGVWSLPTRSSPGAVLLYAEGDGLLYHSEPARRS